MQRKLEAAATLNEMSQVNLMIFHNFNYTTCSLHMQIFLSKNQIYSNREVNSYENDYADVC